MEMLTKWSNSIEGGKPSGLVIPEVHSFHNPNPEILVKVRAALKVGEDPFSFSMDPEQVQSSLSYLEDEKRCLSPYLSEGKTLLTDPSGKALAIIGPEHYYQPPLQYREGQAGVVQSPRVPDKVIHPEVQAFLTWLIAERPRRELIQKKLESKFGGIAVPGSTSFALSFEQSRQAVVREIELYFRGTMERNPESLFNSPCVVYDKTLPDTPNPILVYSQIDFNIPDALTVNPKFDVTRSLVSGLIAGARFSLHSQIYDSKSPELIQFQDSICTLVPQSEPYLSDSLYSVFVDRSGPVLGVTSKSRVNIQKFEINHRERNEKWQVRVCFHLNLQVTCPPGEIKTP